MEILQRCLGLQDYEEYGKMYGDVMAMEPRLCFWGLGACGAGGGGGRKRTTPYPKKSRDIIPLNPD